VAEGRAAWPELQASAEGRRLVFLDESCAKTGMARLYGRSLGGSRCHGRAPAGHWKRVTMLSAVRLDGTTHSMVFDGATDRAVFDEYIREVLAPALTPGDILVLDNLSVRKSAALREAVAARGAEVRFLPPYSPDLNPMEKMWGKVKQALRGIAAETMGELFLAVGRRWTLTLRAMRTGGSGHADI